METTERTEFKFQRTCCACRACVRACETMPGNLIPADIERIHAAVAPEATLEDFAREYLRASPGATVLGGGKLFQIPTIVPAQQDNGHCVFLKDGQCTIHAVAPYGCAFFSMHDSQEEGDLKSRFGLASILADREAGGNYYPLWQRLKTEHGLGPPPSEKRARYLAAEAEEAKSAATT